MLDFGTVDCPACAVGYAPSSGGRCSRCRGSGSVLACTRCAGAGYIPATLVLDSRRQVIDATCVRCLGSGAEPPPLEED